MNTKAQTTPPSETKNESRRLRIKTAAPPPGDPAPLPCSNIIF